MFCIDKVDTTASSYDIIRFVNNLSIRVISCFEVKLRQPAWQRQLNMTVDGWKAFRLCIDINDSSKLLDASKWPEGITISEWFFKPKDDQTRRTVRDQQSYVTVPSSYGADRDEHSHDVLHNGTSLSRHSATAASVAANLAAVRASLDDTARGNSFYNIGADIITLHITRRLLSSSGQP